MLIENEEALYLVALCLFWEILFQFFAGPLATVLFKAAPGFRTTTTKSNFAIFCNSAVHSLSASLHALMMLVDVFYSNDKNGNNTILLRVVHSQFRLHLLADLAYYCVDTLHEAREKVSPTFKAKTLKSLFLLHHFPLVVGYLIYIPWSSRQTAETQLVTSVLTTACWLVHFSTPLQNVKWFMDKSQVLVVSVEEQQRKKFQENVSWALLFYKINFVAFVVLFFVLRIVGVFPLVMSVVWLKQLPASTSFVDVVTAHLPLKCSVSTAFLYVLNVMWFLQNLRSLGRILRMQRPMEKRE